MGEPAKEGTRSAKKATQKSTKSTTAINKKSKAFTDEERAAMKERAQEARPRAKGGSQPRPARGQGGRGERRAREDRRDAGTGSRHGQAAPCDRQGERAGALAENLVRDARLCQGRQGPLLLPKRAEVQREVRDVRLQRQGEPRRRRHVGNLLRAEGADSHRRGKDQRAREEGGEPSRLLSPAPRLATTSAKENQRLFTGVPGRGILRSPQPCIAPVLPFKVHPSTRAGGLIITFGAALPSKQRSRCTRGGMDLLRGRQFWRLSATSKPLAPSLLAHHQHRAVGVADHRIGDASHQRPPQGPKAPASQHDESRAELISQSHDLRIGPAKPRVYLRYLAAGLPYPLHLLVEHCSSLLLGTLLHPS